MYFKFQENLPTSVLRAVFDFYKENDPAHSFPSLTAAIQHKSTLLEVPEQATHLRAIRFLTAHSSFLYYFPDEGYPLEKGSFLPSLLSAPMPWAIAMQAEWSCKQVLTGRRTP